LTAVNRRGMPGEKKLLGKPKRRKPTRELCEGHRPTRNVRKGSPETFLQKKERKNFVKGGSGGRHSLGRGGFVKDLAQNPGKKKRGKRRQ